MSAICTPARGAARALLQLGQREDARRLAHAELDDAQGVRSASRARDRVARRRPRARRQGRAELLHESVSMLRARRRCSSAAHSLTELGPALRRAGQRANARESLAEALDLAARCGACPLAARTREELKATGARPRREWRTGVEALTPSGSASSGSRPWADEPGDRPRALRHAQDGRGSPLPRLHEARDRGARRPCPGLDEEKTRVPTL